MENKLILLSLDFGRRRFNTCSVVIYAELGLVRIGLLVEAHEEFAARRPSRLTVDGRGSDLR